MSYQVSDAPDFAVPDPRQPGTSRRYIASFAAAAVAAAAVGAGVWAWQSFMEQGAQPAEALPASTLAYAALDLDPPGGQKVAAYNALRKFPSIKSELGLDSVDDVQKSLVDEVASDSSCGLSYAAFKPWLGERMAAAVVQQRNPEPVAVLQVADAAKARASLTSLADRCGFGFSLTDGWAVLAQSQDIAEKVSGAATTRKLSDDSDYKRLTGAAGSAGLVTLYAAPEAGQALLDSMEDDPFSAYFVLQGVNMAYDPVTSFVSSFGLLGTARSLSATASGDDEAFEEPKLTDAQRREQERIERQYMRYDKLTPEQKKALEADSEKFYTELYRGQTASGIDVEEEGDPEFTDEEDPFGTPEIDPDLRASLEKFTGLGGIGRIADGAVEVEIVGDELQGTSAAMYGGTKGEELVSDLPKDSAIAFGAGLADDWVDQLFAQLSSAFPFGGGSDKAETIMAFEKATGLSVPEDLEALGGEGFGITAGSGIGLDSVFDDPKDAPVAIRVRGDAARVEAALDKLRAHLGDGSTQLLSARVGDDVVISANASYLKQLQRDGDLGGSDTYDQVVKDADGATSIFFVNFDAGDWLVRQQGSDRDRADAKPLRGLGITVSKDDDEQHLRFRLSFD